MNFAIITLSSTFPIVWGHPKLDALGELCESMGNGRWE